MSDWNVKLDLTKLRTKTLRGWWFDPRTGVGTLIGPVEGAANREFKSPSYGPDWVLVRTMQRPGMLLRGLVVLAVELE